MNEYDDIALSAGMLFTGFLVSVMFAYILYYSLRGSVQAVKDAIHWIRKHRK